MNHSSKYNLKSWDLNWVDKGFKGWISLAFWMMYIMIQKHPLMSTSFRIKAISVLAPYSVFVASPSHYLKWCQVYPYYCNFGITVVAWVYKILWIASGKMTSERKTEPKSLLLWIQAWNECFMVISFLCMKKRSKTETFFNRLDFGFQSECRHQGKVISSWLDSTKMGASSHNSYFSFLP